MTRACAGSRERAQLSRRNLSLVIAAVALGVAACFDASAPTASPTLETSSSPSPLESLPPSTSSEPSGPVPSQASPSELAPTKSTASDGPSPSASGGSSAAGCSGTDANRDFYAAVAQDVEWQVYCPVLPTGWFVDSGSYRLAGGGWMVIAYNGPGGARLQLSEGAFCSEADGCVPAGTEVGPAMFGDRAGVIHAAADGSWAVVVDRGAALSWLVEGRGIGESTFRGFAADLEPVG